MVTGTSPSFERIDSVLQALGATGGAPEAHGSLCGLACFFGNKARDLWVAELIGGGIRPGERDAAGEDVLGLLASDTCAALAEGDMSFLLLLPPDDQPLSLRTEGLAEWCAGFMHGLGEAAGNTASRDALGGEVMREIMADFGEIARLSLGDDEADLEAESAYTELVEFVRVSVQLMFEELYEVRRRLAAASMH
jgi:uncharacterized protein YgfB (UPF0149 family)